ncbi:MAG: RecQ family ATP-dependent DNA helicase [Candidatus Omnitrophica bacterium]|nr:RecQ family ATP-dependent DNA helicase [Candidatus Omnitrophota bacterium]
MASPFTSRVKHSPHLELKNSAICSHGSTCACEHEIDSKSGGKNLGILRNNLPTKEINDLTFFDPKTTTTLSADNSIAIENKLNRYIRQNAARELLPHERIGDCMRKNTFSNVLVKKAVLDGKSYFANLFTCGSGWNCAVCGAKITEYRRAELVYATDRHVKDNGKNSLLLITYTYPHGREDDLELLLEKQAIALDFFNSHRDYVNLSEDLKKIGHVRALEVTHGQVNSWHPHVHEIWFLERETTDAEYLSNFFAIKNTIYKLWKTACEYAGLGEPSWDYGIDVRGGSYAAKYIAKWGTDERIGDEFDSQNRNWGMEDELTKWGAKVGRKIGADGKPSRTPFQLLDDYADGDAQAGKLFVEYAAAIKGRQQLRWSKGMKKHFDIANMPDKAIVKSDPALSYIFASIPLVDWVIVRKHCHFKSDARVNLLTLADANDVKGFWQYIDQLAGRDPSIRVFDENSPDHGQLSLALEFALGDAPIEQKIALELPNQNQEEFSLISKQNALPLHFEVENVSEYVNKQPLDVLKQVYGYDSFRGIQSEVINHVVAGGNALALMPTGAGKSVCFQIPALVREGVGVVISPLIALMKDQVDALLNLGIKAAFLNSTLPEGQVKKIEQRLLEGDIDLLYISPERLAVPRTLSLLANLNISLFAIDEAHCVAQWGHDFRSDYLKVNLLWKHFPHIPRIALTATADQRTRDEIIERLHLQDAPQFVTAFDRPNICYRIETINNKHAALRRLTNFIYDEHFDHSGIVYCLSRAKVNETVEYLIAEGFDALPYHAGMSNGARKRNQQDFLTRDNVIMVATIAFGMGIDKPDVRFVAHLDVSSSIEAYYQETGRAGRDGLPANALMIYSAHSVNSRRRNFIYEMTSQHQKELADQKLTDMQNLSTQKTCRRQTLVRYFGDVLHQPCGNCDVCLDQNFSKQKMKSAIGSAEIT